jgi:hypothetical protein
MGVGVMAGALIIGPKERAAIAEVIARAATRVTPLDQMKLAHAFRERTGAAFNPLNEDLTIVVPLGWHITYTHEEQPGAVCRHMSVSVEGGRGPGPQGVAYLFIPMQRKASNATVGLLEMRSLCRVRTAVTAG